MSSKRGRLDRFLSKHLSIKRKDIRLLLASGRVNVNHEVAKDAQELINPFTHIQVDTEVLQNNKPVYIQLHKPKGVVSATQDSKHITVIDLLAAKSHKDLHIAGRLDFNSTGLLLLTNNGFWSRRLSTPEYRVEKKYQVTLDKPITPEIINAFKTGIYFAHENIITKPALLTVTENIKNSLYYGEVTLVEGRYHQIKRMFGHFQIQVLNLHRLSIGNLMLDKNLAAGESRHLTEQEIVSIF